jgi:hypothetical protein
LQSLNILSPQGWNTNELFNIFMQCLIVTHVLMIEERGISVGKNG